MKNNVSYKVGGMIKNINAVGKRVLFISDQHFPYCHDDTLNFLGAIKEKYDPEIIINVGDELDKHALSFHPSDPDLDSAGKELEMAMRWLHDDNGLHTIFPKMDLFESNHGSLLYRKAKVNGIPRRYLKTYQDVLETPKWNWHHEVLIKTKIGDIYGCHGQSGTYGALAKEMGCSAVQGHFHTKCEVTWHETALGFRFNMFVGCLADRDKMAMAYAKNFVKKFQLSVGMLSKEGYPSLIRMNLKGNGRWDKKLP